MVSLLRQILTPGTTGRCESIALSVDRTDIQCRPPKASKNVPKRSERSKHENAYPKAVPKMSKREQKKRNYAKTNCPGFRLLSLAEACDMIPTNSALLLRL